MSKKIRELKTIPLLYRSQLLRNKMGNFKDITTFMKHNDGKVYPSLKIYVGGGHCH